MDCLHISPGYQTERDSNFRWLILRRFIKSLQMPNYWKIILFGLSIINIRANIQDRSRERTYDLIYSLT